MKPRGKIKIIAVVGARPNFVKMAPILEALARYSRVETVLVHTGQHYNKSLSKVFFEELELPRPDIDLGIGSGTHARQTAKIMAAFEKRLLKDRPDLVLVVGDVNSTVAAALAAVKLHVRVAHVEAGLRSFNRRMPEEINRLLTDQIGDYLFTTSRPAGENLLREGVEKRKIFFVGNVMIDSLKRFLAGAEESSRILSRLKLAPGEYGVLTLHRPEIVDNKAALKKVLGILGGVGRRLPVVYPVHPRTAKMFRVFGLEKRLRSLPGIIVTPPLGYLDFLKLLARARLVLTDSGGIQEETTVLGVPCLTLRTETERPITCVEGTNTVVGLDEKKIEREVEKILSGKGKRGRVPELWDGKAAPRIAKILNYELR